MDFKFDPEVLEYMKQKNQSAITIKMIRKGGGWCSIPAPYVMLEEPKSSANYKMYEQNGIKVHISDLIESKDDSLHFWLKKFLMFKEIVVDGVKVI